METESWKTIDGFESYEVSTLGRIKHLKSGRISNGTINEEGYRRFSFRLNGRSVWRGVHRIAAIAFLGNPPAKHVCNHIDGKRDHNIIENLEWVTRSRNSQHGYDIGTHKRFDPMRHPGRKLNHEKAKQIRRLYAEGLKNQTEIGRRFGVSQVLVNRVLNFKSWKPYPFPK